MPTPRYIRLEPEQDARLREVEQDPNLRSKVRLRAQVLRLSGRGESIKGISSYTGRSEASISRDLDRWEDRRLEGLADGSAPGNPPRVTEEAKEFLKERLSEQRTWNAPQLAEALLDRFRISVSAEAIRQHLIAMGYSWKRTRYVPSKEPDPERESEAREELASLKKGPSKAR
jgi:transposase